MKWNLPRFFQPQLLVDLKNYSRARFGQDVLAGLTVGCIALPLAMALGIQSGPNLGPQYGLYTAVVAGFLISALGGSRVQIGGPTAAFIPIVYGIIERHGLGGLAICTMMAGGLLILMGVFRVGNLIKFIPLPVTTGFTTGIAVVIMLGQFKDFLGLKAASWPSDTSERLKILAEALGTTHVSTALLSALALAIVYFWPRKVTRKFPGSIIALVVCTVIALALNLPVETIGSKFGGIPRSLPALHFPEFQPSLMRDLFGDALAIALLAGIESLLSAVVADGLMPGRKHDPNTELIAQGVANVASPLFGGIPATGAIARTVANIESGGATPVAGMIHAAMLLFIMLVAAPLAKSIPLGVLSAILVGVALQMGEWSEFRKLGRMPRSDAAVFITTFGLMVMTELTTAMKYGMLCAFFMVVKRLADTTLVREVTAENDPEGSQHSLAGKEIPVGVMVYEINGAFLFGAAEKLESALEEMGALPKVLILRMNRVHAMDATALNALEIVVEKMRAKGNDVVLSGPHTQPYLMMVQAGFIDSLGMDKVAADLDQALWISQRLLSNRK